MRDNNSEMPPDTNQKSQNQDRGQHPEAGGGDGGGCGRKSQPGDTHSGAGVEEDSWVASHKIKQALPVRSSNPAFLAFTQMN